MAKAGDEIIIAGKKLVCPICENKRFFAKAVQLNTAGMTFLGLDWANTSADTYYCDACGYMFWFHPLG